MGLLLVDDDRELTDLLEFSFKRAGLVALVAHDPPAALRLYDLEQPELVILDIDLGAWNGLDLLQELRRGGATVPIVMLTALDSEDQKVKGLELGADDYITKPFGHRELIARVRGHLRRAGREIPEADAGPRILRVGGLELNVGEHSARLRDQPIALTVTEFRLLHVLMREAGTVVSTRQLLRSVWGYDDPTATDVVRVTIHRLRKKLQEDPTDPKLLHTIPGVGVILKAGTAEGSTTDGTEG